MNRIGRGHPAVNSLYHKRFPNHTLRAAHQLVEGVSSRCHSPVAPPRARLTERPHMGTCAEH